MTLFTVQLELSDGEQQAIDYETIVACLRDPWLRTLFSDGFVVGCSIYCDGQRLTARPIVTLDVLLNQVVCNSTTILRKTVA